jgi:ribosomal protein S27AE
MPRKQKISCEKVLAALNTICPECGYSIPPAEIRRVDFDKMKCPKCGEIFTTTPKRD